MPIALARRFGRQRAGLTSSVRSSVARACTVRTVDAHVDDNPFCAAVFRTLQYRPEYPHRPFETIEAARAWVTAFLAGYDAEHRHGGIRLVTPDQRHHGRENAVLANRARVYERARRRHPSRWSRGTRNWTPAPAVFLDPKRDQETIASKLARSTASGTSPRSGPIAGDAAIGRRRVLPAAAEGVRARGGLLQPTALLTRGRALPSAARS